MGCDQAVTIERRKLPKNINQMGLIQAILKELKQQGIRGNIHYRYFNAVIDAANRVCDEFARETIIAPPGSGIKAWLASDEVGASSLFMARTLAPVAGIATRLEHKYAHENRYPLDVDDFRRCVQMLEAAPELRQHIAEMKKQGPVWERLADKWAELESLYETERGGGNCPKTYAVLTECVK